MSLKNHCKSNTYSDFVYNCEGVLILASTIAGAFFVSAGLLEAFSDSKLSATFQDCHTKLPEAIEYIVHRLDDRTAIEKTSFGCNLILAGRLLKNKWYKKNKGSDLKY